MPNKNHHVEPIVRFLTQERLRNRMTQKQISKLSNIRLRTYQRIEQGESDITISQINRICEIYGISWLDIAYAESGRRHINISDLVGALKNLPPNLRQTTFELIKAINNELDEMDRSAKGN